MGHGFVNGSPSHRSPAGRKKPVRGLDELPGPPQMEGQEFRLVLDQLREVLLEIAGNGGVEAAAIAAQKGKVRRFLDERVAELVGGSRRVHARLEDRGRDERIDVRL